jgi:ribonuclease P protein component
MLSKKLRFSTSDFSLIKTLKPQKVFTDIGVFCIYKNLQNDLGESKFAIVVPKKIFKTAVSRNKHKRIFFNVLQNYLTQPLLAKVRSSACSIIFYPRKNFNKEELKKELATVL